MIYMYYVCMYIFNRTNVNVEKCNVSINRLGNVVFDVIFLNYLLIFLYV